MSTAHLPPVVPLSVFRLAPVYRLMMLETAPIVGPEQIPDRIKNHWSRIRACWSGRTLLGYTRWNPTTRGDIVWLDLIWTDASARGKGVGRWLMLDLEKRLLRRGVKRVELAVAPYNTRAHDFYRRMGYSQVERPGTFLSFVKNISPDSPYPIEGKIDYEVLVDRPTLLGRIWRNIIFYLFAFRTRA